MSCRYCDITVWKSARMTSAQSWSRDWADVITGLSQRHPCRFWNGYISLSTKHYYLSFLCSSKTQRTIFMQKLCHYVDVIMRAMASQITSFTIVCSNVYSGTDQRKHLSSASLAFVGEFTGNRWIPRQLANNAKNVCICLRHHDTNRALLCSL